MARKGQSIEILAGWQAGIGAEDFLRELVERTVQQILEAEITGFLGAESCQRNGARRGWRNGYQPRTLKMRVGELELMVPKDRDGQFQTELFERCRPCSLPWIRPLAKSMDCASSGIAIRNGSAFCA